MSSTKKVAIIGGGASGLICAIFCAKSSISVDLFEQNEKCAKKILASGNGRCNITNTIVTPSDYFSQNPLFTHNALNEFGYEQFENFCNSIGLMLDVKEDGRVYPLSNEAKSVAALLVEYATNLGVSFHFQEKITSIEPLLKKYSAVVIATGSQAAPQLGGNDDGVKFARTLGHNIVPTYPSLVGLHLNSKLCKKMSGAKSTATLTLTVDNKTAQTTYGDILFSDYGASGFAILDISQQASKSLMQKKKVAIKIDLVPTLSQEKLSSHITKTIQSVPNMSTINLISSIVPYKISAALLEHLEIAPQRPIKLLNQKRLASITNTLRSWQFEIIDTHGFKHAEVCGGGVDTKEINPKTMESLKRKNIYFCGEVLDVVGRRGGFNFAFAWASGYLAAKNLAKIFATRSK